jgi:hypothetical protein
MIMAIIGQCLGIGTKECHNSANTGEELCMSCQIKKLLNKYQCSQAENKNLLWFIGTLRDVFSYNEYSIINLDLILECLKTVEDCDCFTKEEYSKIEVSLIESGLALLPTTNKAIRALKGEK